MQSGDIHKVASQRLFLVAEIADWVADADVCEKFAVWQGHLSCNLNTELEFTSKEN